MRGAIAAGPCCRWRLGAGVGAGAMAAEGKVTGQSQEQFLLLAKAARGAALASLIHQVLEAPGIYVFGELLDMPAVREVSPDPAPAPAPPHSPAPCPDPSPLSRSWPTASSRPSFAS